MTEMKSTRRLPIYMLVDTSGSMTGGSTVGNAKIEQVQRGLGVMKQILANTPDTQASTHVSLITFNSTAENIVKLTGIMDFHVPKLEAAGQTSFVKALDMLMACYNTDVIKRTASNQNVADYKPILLVFSDGVTTDSSSELRDAINNFRERQYHKFGACICFYAHNSTDSDSEMNRARACLEQICGKDQNGDGKGTLIDVTDDYESIVGFFKAFSQSIVSSQKSNEDPAKGLNANLKHELGDEIDQGMQFF